MNISTHISLFEATLLQVFLLRTSLTITTKMKAPWTNRGKIRTNATKGQL